LNIPEQLIYIHVQSRSSTPQAAPNVQVEESKEINDSSIKHKEKQDFKIKLEEVKEDQNNYKAATLSLNSGGGAVKAVMNEESI
jgi:phosphatidate phosphatase PAH1